MPNSVDQSKNKVGSKPNVNLKMYPRPAYGVVSDADKPEGFVPTEIKGHLLPTETYHGNQANLTFTCQPPVPLNSTFATYPDKWTECIVTPPVKAKILNTPGYPKPLNRPPEKRHRIGRSPCGGLGVFATVDLKSGDLVFSERAMMILSPAMHMPQNVPSHFTRAQVHQAALAQKEKEVEIGFDRLLDENKRAFMALWNSHKQDGSGPLMGIVRTNSYMVDLYDDDEGSAEMERIPYAGIWDEGSRINHSCCPNILRHFNHVTFAKEFRAVRNIKAGEEIFTQYTDPASFKPQRQQELNPYGFQCRCGSCKAMDSDDVRIKLHLGLPSQVGYKRFAVFLMAPATLSESYVVDHSLEQIKLIEKAGLEVCAWYIPHLRFLVEVYCAIGNVRKALIYLRKAEVMERGHSGGEEKPVKVLMAMVKDHPRWNYKQVVQGAMKAAGINT